MFQPNHLIMTRRLDLSGSSWFWSCRRSPVVWYLSPDELFNWSQTTTKKPHHRNFSRMTSKEWRPSVYITLCHLSARQISRTSCLQTVNIYVERRYEIFPAGSWWPVIWSSAPDLLLSRIKDRISTWSWTNLKIAQFRLYEVWISAGDKIIKIANILR